MQQGGLKVIGKYTITKNLLGKGGFGEVYKAHLTEDPLTNFAAKIVSLIGMKRTDKIKKQLDNEVQIMSKIQSRNIVKLHDVIQTKHSLYLFMDYCDGGTLSQLMREQSFTEHQIIEILQDIVAGFTVLAAQKIMHRDVKGDNILIHQGVMKITDFGLASPFETQFGVPQIDLKGIQLLILEYTQQDHVGTHNFMCPQILRQQPYTNKCDIWSLGVLTYQMLYKKYPWQQGQDPQELTKNILTLQLDFPLEPACSYELKQLLSRMIVIEEQNRISWPKIFNHPYFRPQISEYQFVSSLLLNNLSEPIHELPWANNSDVNDRPIEELDRRIAANYARKKQVQESEQQNKSGEKIINQLKNGILQQVPSIMQNSVQSVVNDFSNQSIASGPVFDMYQALEGIQLDQFTLQTLKSDCILSELSQTQQSEQQQIKDYHKFMWYQRNIGCFLNLVMHHIIVSQQAQKIALHNDLYCGILFCISKHQLIHVYRIESLLFNTNNTLPQQTFIKYSESAQFKQIEAQLEKDIEQVDTQFIEFFQALKRNLVQQANWPINQINIKIKKILNLDSSQSRVFYEIHTWVIIEIINALKVMRSNVELVKTIWLLTICLNPYDYFESIYFDFKEFFTAMDNATVEYIMQKLTKIYDLS